MYQLGFGRKFKNILVELIQMFAQFVLISYITSIDKRFADDPRVNAPAPVEAPPPPGRRAAARSQSCGAASVEKTASE